jgi:glycosyltransferase involved in cell wall biosynthesis
MRIFGWSNAQGGVHHYRIREPLRGLALRGHETKTLPAATAEIFEQWDVVLVRGLHHPRNSMLWRWAAQAQTHALRVYDLDDDIWGWHPDSQEDHYWNEQRRLNAELNIQCADLVTTPTHSLAEVLRELNQNVAVLPNTIPDRLLKLLPQQRNGSFIVGWQGAQQHVRDLELIYDPVLRFMLRHPDVQFHVWGPQGIADFPDALQSRIVAYPWISSVWGHYMRLRMDVGLAPIDPTYRFNETKSDVRLREYAALGIPFVASRSEAYTTTANATRGLVAETAGEWEDALELLYKDARLRDWMAEQGRLRARLWTTEANASETERIYVGAIHRRDKARNHPGTLFLPYSNDGDRAIENVGTKENRL